MLPNPAPSAAEHRVLRWFVAGFLALALLVAGVTWWRKSQACKASCVERGQAGSELRLSGGGRLNMSLQCHCVAR
jgi:hypothetical protein